MNIYEMLKKNNGKIGFWIQRSSWVISCAKVVRIGQMRGYPPYYGNPIVRVDMYKIVTGEVLDKNVRLSCPGTGDYKKINAPDWYKKIKKKGIKSKRENREKIT
jgi:hypothetical protein